LIAETILLFLRQFTTSLQTGSLFGTEGPLEFAFDAATGIFSLVLFAITLYAWATRGRQPTLLIVSMGFLTFFIKKLAGVLPLIDLHGELFRSFMDFLTLALFFVALVVRPQRREKIAQPRGETNNIGTA
jgi:cbb3-type cytochrome oxidase subunit 3